jgi:hypothetical protein
MPGLLPQRIPGSKERSLTQMTSRKTLGKKQVGVPVAEASSRTNAVSANDGVKMFEKLAGTVES